MVREYHWRINAVRTMTKSRKHSTSNDLAHRAEQLALTKERFEQELEQVSASGVVAPQGCVDCTRF
ncbi:MAG: hypothetical protein F6K55_12745 [Moorea sp. SIO4A3]|uniref:hypothetical protein n=1 Tax=Moorena sp. SIO4A1 TaxID=2607835 RepID=UPI0014185A09|nr:hypothetical protein [Moorena sp. SIO4A1]NEO44944.1 hypothetical protein [Moorena sp. SIO4A3]